MSRHFSDLDSVLESDALNDLRKLVLAAQSAALHEMEHEGIDVTAPDRLTALSNVAALEILVTRSI